MARPTIARPLTPAPSPDRAPQDPTDLLENKLTQLKSLTWACYGGGIDWFNGVGPQHLDNVLWAVADMVGEAEALFQESEKARHEKR